jgi:glycosyltransferase involved in cell wall biosynthesis
MTESADRYLVVRPDLDAAARFVDPTLATMTERHHYVPSVVWRFRAMSGTEAILSSARDAKGIILELASGLPNRKQIAFAKEVLARGHQLFVFWPHEEAIECVDREYLRSLRVHRVVFIASLRIRERWSRRTRANPPQSAADGTPNVAAAVIAAQIAHIGAEATSLETHLDGGISDLKQVSSAIESALTSQLNAAQAEAVGASERIRATGDIPLAESSGRLRAALDGIAAATTQLRTYSGNIVSYLESGLPVLTRIKQQADQAANDVDRIAPPAVVAAPLVASGVGKGDLSELFSVMRELDAKSSPVPFRLPQPPTVELPISGTGVYLRLDYWAPLVSGGSYGHTCYQAKSLAKLSQDFVALTANRFRLLDELDVRQVVLQPPDRTGVEASILSANAFYLDRLGPILDAMRPTYIFERAVLGNVVGAWASQKFGIPYVVEYNGSEISMKRSFADSSYQHEDMLLLAEQVAFRQATIISVVSEHVASDVEKRGLPRERIFVNPNAVDLDAYKPAAETERRAIRAELGFGDSHIVVGFIGTFGGWHGIDVLAAALPQIVGIDAAVRVLLIGDGNLKHLVHAAIVAHRLEDQVVDVGRVEQTRGARLLKACDVLVSPHSSHMVDSPFFGSPTKLFEYMAMGVGIVASDLEQIGKVLAPAASAADVERESFAVTDERAILCQPGSVDEFVAGVRALVRRPQIGVALGRNARSAAERYYTWDQHVRNLWLRVLGRVPEGYATDWASNARSDVAKVDH